MYNNILGKKYDYLEDDVRDLYIMTSRYGEKALKEITTMIKHDPKIDMVIILNGVIYKPYSYNKIHHIFKNIITNKKICIPWSLFFKFMYYPLQYATNKINNNNIPEPVPSSRYRLMQ